MDRIEPNEVVVSAGEPVAWELKDGRDAPWWTNVRSIADRAADEGEECEALFAAAPVVLPETPPDELIEQMAKAASGLTDESWVTVGGLFRNSHRVAARSSYAALRAWVAGGGETG